jgi:hypothetical protein
MAQNKFRGNPKSLPMVASLSTIYRISDLSDISDLFGSVPSIRLPPSSLPLFLFRIQQSPKYPKYPKWKGRPRTTPGHTPIASCRRFGAFAPIGNEVATRRAALSNVDGVSVVDGVSCTRLQTALGSSSSSISSLLPKISNNACRHRARPCRARPRGHPGHRPPSRQKIERPVNCTPLVVGGMESSSTTWNWFARNSRDRSTSSYDVESEF